jgi:hypothetical protein
MYGGSVNEVATGEEKESYARGELSEANRIGTLSCAGRCFLWRSGRDTSTIQASTCTFIQTSFTRNYAWIRMSGPKRRPEKSANFNQLKPSPKPESPVANMNFGEILKTRSMSLIHNLYRISTNNYKLFLQIYWTICNTAWVSLPYVQWNTSLCNPRTLNLKCISIIY